MKLRTLFSFGAAAGISVAATAATLTSENVYGILTLADTTHSNLIISVPWVDCADAEQGVFVSNVVKTTNLKAGDYLIRKSGDTYQSWVLTGTAPALYWAPQIIQNAGVTTTTEGADTARIMRGDALWLHRANPSASSPIHLFGQYSSAAVDTAIAAGTTTLLANPGAQGILPGNLTWSKGAPAAGDKILVNDVSGYRTYTYNGSKWTYKKPGGSVTTTPLPGTSQSAQMWVEADAETIPAGTGFWYQSKTGAGTITW